MAFTFTASPTGATDMTAGAVTARIFDDSTAFNTWVATFPSADQATYSDYTDGYALTTIHAQATAADVAGGMGVIITGTNGTQSFSSMTQDLAGTRTDSTAAALTDGSTDITTGFTT